MRREGFDYAQSSQGDTMLKMTPKQYAKSLRLIADWYEHQVESMPIPYDFCGAVLYWDDEKAQAAQAIEIAHALGDTEKVHQNEYLTIQRKFGELYLKFLFNRSAVCTRRVVGEEEVPEHIIAGYTKEIVEWDCHPLLAGKRDNEAP